MIIIVKEKTNKTNEIRNKYWEYFISGEQIALPLIPKYLFPCVEAVQCFNMGGFFLEFFRDEPFVMKKKGLVFLLLKSLVTIIVSIGTYGIPFYNKVFSSYALLYLVNIVFYLAGITLDKTQVAPIINAINKGNKVTVIDKFNVYITTHTWVMVFLVFITELSLISLKLTHKI